MNTAEQIPEWHMFKTHTMWCEEHQRSCHHTARQRMIDFETQEIEALIRTDEAIKRARAAFKSSAE